MQTGTSIILHLGSNEADRMYYLRAALRRLELVLGPIKRISKIYETEAWGLETQNDFLNLAAEIVSQESAPERILRQTQKIEIEMGRVKSLRWGPRCIDIDILGIGDMIWNSENVEIPHPGIPSRNFVLYPLRDICPNYVHPISKQSIDTLIELTPDCKTVSVFSDYIKI